MGYDVFKFGALYLDNKILSIPQQPTEKGDIPQYDKKSAISIRVVAKEKSITWIKPAGFNILIADRVLLSSVSWENLDQNGFVNGKGIVIARQHFYCRLLHVGNDEGVPNEWDKALDETGQDNFLWHWGDMTFLGSDVSAFSSAYRACRGGYSARYWGHDSASNRNVYLGFRPALELLPSDDPSPNINLDGVDFQLTGLPGSDTFCPILQPIQEDVFKDIPVEGKVRMYTFTKAGRPVHMDEPVKDPHKLTLTNRYFGDEYLIPWVISNGVAVASQSLKQQI